MPRAVRYDQYGPLVVLRVVEVGNEAGELTVPISAVYPIDQVRAAYAQLADGHTRGKIVLRMR